MTQSLYVDPVRLLSTEASSRQSRAVAAMEAAGEPVRVHPPDGDSADRLLWISLDNRGVELEVIAIEQPYGLLVIHAMPTFYRRKRE